MEDVRLLLYSHDGFPMGELSKRAGSLKSAEMSLEINGEHSLSIETRRHLEVGMRALLRDPNGRWREFVVDEADESHDDMRYGSGSYHLIWSLQYDLQTVFPGDVHQPGMDDVKGCTAQYAMECALSGTKRWTVGTVDVETMSFTIMCYNSAWERLNIVVKYWGGEIDDEIVVGESGVVARKVNLLAHQGAKLAYRRLEWHHDMTSIDRNPDPGPYYCRVMPLGNGETEVADDGETTFNWPIDLSELEMDKCLRDEEAELLFRVPDGEGGWEYPTMPVTYSTDDPELLYLLAVDDLYSHTRPKVSYSATISQFVEAGMNVTGVDIGDEVQVHDYGFNEEFPLVIQERVLRLEWDLFGVDDKRITIGRKTPSLEKVVSNLIETVPLDYTPPVFDWTLPEVPTHPILQVDTPDYTVPVSAVDYDPLEFDIGDQDKRISDLENIIGSLIDYDDGGEYVYDPETGEYVYDVPGIKEATEYFDNPTFDDSGFGEYLARPTDTEFTFGRPTEYDFGDGTGTSYGTVYGNGGDGWIHQIDGVTQQTGTINFITEGGSSGESATPSSGSSSSHGGTNASNVTPVPATKDVKNGTESTKQSIDNVKKRSGKRTSLPTKSSSSTDTSDDTVAKQRKMAIQTATIGNKTIDINNPWRSSGGEGTMVDPGKFIKEGIADLFTGLFNG